MGFMNFKSMMAAATVALLSLPVASHAATMIEVYNDLDVTADSDSAVGGVSGGLRGTVTCSEFCSILYYDAGAYAFGDPGEVFDGPMNSGDAEEALWVNGVIDALTGTDPMFTATDVGSEYQDNGNAYTGQSLYVVMKIGNNPDYILIRNDFGGEQTYSYAAAPGTPGPNGLRASQGGLSHTFGLGSTGLCPDGSQPDPFTGCDGLTGVPLPAGLPLLLTAVGLGAYLRTRARKSA